MAVALHTAFMTQFSQFESSLVQDRHYAIASSNIVKECYGIGAVRSHVGRLPVGHVQHGYWKVHHGQEQGGQRR